MWQEEDVQMLKLHFGTMCFGHGAMRQRTQVPVTWWLLYLAQEVTDRRNTSGCHRASKWAGCNGQCMGRECSDQLQDSDAVHGASKGRNSRFVWDVFQCPSLLALFPHPHWYWLILTMTQFHSASHHRGKETLLLWFYVKKLSDFSLYKSQAGESVATHFEDHLSNPCSSAHACSLFIRMLRVTWFNN